MNWCFTFQLNILYNILSIKARRVFHHPGQLSFPTKEGREAGAGADGDREHNGSEGRDLPAAEMTGGFLEKLSAPAIPVRLLGGRKFTHSKQGGGVVYPTVPRFPLLLFRQNRRREGLLPRLMLVFPPPPAEWWKVSDGGPLHLPCLGSGGKNGGFFSSL